MGQIALEYADRYPKAISKLILIGAVPYSFAEFADETKELWDELASEERKVLLESRTKDLDQALEAAPSERSFAVSYDRRGPLYWADPSYDATDLLDGLENGPAFGRLVESLPVRYAVRSRLERIDVPILLVLGKLDFAIPYKCWERLIDGLPNIKYVLLADDSHNPQTESPQRFDPIFIDWVRQA